METTRVVRTVFMVLAAFVTVYAWASDLRATHPEFGATVIVVSIAYLALEVFGIGIVVEKVPWMLRFVFAVILSCAAIGLILAHPKGAAIQIGVTLGADKGIGHDAIVDCAKPLYHCMSEEQAKQTKPLVLEVGTKSWARIIYRMENVGATRALNSSVHVESPDAISIDFAPNPNPQRLPRNVLELNGGDLQPLDIAKGGYVVPLDVYVPAGISEATINFKVFGNNLPAHELSLRYQIKR